LLNDRCVDFYGDAKRFVIFRFMCGPMSIFDERLSICSDPARAYPKCGVLLPPTPTPPTPTPPFNPDCSVSRCTFTTTEPPTPPTPTPPFNPDCSVSRCTFTPPTPTEVTDPSTTPTPTEVTDPSTPPTPTGVTDPSATPTPTGSTDPSPTPTPTGSTDPSPTPTPTGSTDPSAPPTPTGSTDPSPTPTPTGSTDPSPTPTPTQGTYRPPRPPFNIDCSNENLHSYPYDCSRFYQCVQEGNQDRIYVFSCAAGLHFNETRSECVLESESTCNIVTTNSTLLNGNFVLDCGTDDLHRYPLNCNYFYQCFKDGTTNTIFVYSCADDLVFDEPTNSCKKPNETSSCSISEVIRNSPFPAGQPISIYQLSKFTKYSEDVNSPLQEIPRPFKLKATSR